MFFKKDNYPIEKNCLSFSNNLSSFITHSKNKTIFSFWHFLENTPYYKNSSVEKVSSLEISQDSLFCFSGSILKSNKW